jgi:hypothetical protein
MPPTIVHHPAWSWHDSRRIQTTFSDVYKALIFSNPQLAGDFSDPEPMSTHHFSLLELALSR